ncbi:putative ABC transport system permease protein [Anaerosphaera aminiphila DSM 21120]|uniref:Putative ABC transport system permease protein n=1 Tax=Anaerosphaera aminiphila DSM 21120 TaxID=1120995 RepID=A0A1M5Q5M4_9FIRM|nr:ABC transporter permease [Anaerosphaera aminiphila]SHH09298.1 putative ABC transport system permease protein [Anaerosphaera aminiphila DSM 21120]
MKNYLDLVSISAKKNRRKNTMTIICIVLAVFLVSAIFGMADMEIRSQKIQIIKDEGNWHYGFNVDQSDAEMISLRPDVKSSGLYSQMLENQGYLIGDKKISIVGMDKEPFENIFDLKIVEGKYPENDDEILISENAKRGLKSSIGDSVILSSPSGGAINFTVVGFMESTSLNLADDFYGAWLTSNSFAKNITEGVKQSKFLVQFSPYSNMKKNLSEIKDSYNLSDSQVEGNTKLLGILGQSDHNYALQLYTVAFVLFVLVMLSGIIMITNSLNTNVIQRTEFFGLMRCLGATDKQVMKFVRKEALNWCKIAIPIGVLMSVVVVWALCGVLRFASPRYFSEMPIFGVSVVGIVLGVVVGVLTVLLAAQSPAKKASKVSPLMAIRGNANNIKAVKKAANTKLFNVETALGIEHAKSNKKNFILMVSSFSLSIILFLAFSSIIDFMNHGVKPIRPSSPDFSIISRENSLINVDLVRELEEIKGVKKVYGLMNDSDITAVINNREVEISLNSYEKNRINWAKRDLLKGSLSDVENGGVLIVKDRENAFKVGDSVNLKVNGNIFDLKVVGLLSSADLYSEQEILICSEDTFKKLTGKSGYSVIDIQFNRDVTDGDIEEIHEIAGEYVDYSDLREGKSEAKGAYYSMLLFIYGFIAVISLITVFNINNSVSMSVSARTKQYGFMRAVGMSDKQLLKMVASETLTYSIVGSIVGCAVGVTINKYLFKNMVTAYWGTPWTLPLTEISVIVLIVIGASIVAIYSPYNRIKKMSIVETIRAE